MNPLAATLARQLASPSGTGGRLVGQAMRVANRRPTRLAITALDVRRGDTVLDLGCGTGDAIPALTAAAGTGRVYGLDHSQDMIASARRRHPGAAFYAAPFTDIPMLDESVDRILASNVAYFWHDDRAVLGEIRRVLRRGGRLAVYATTGDSLRRIGIGSSETHRQLTPADLQVMLGPAAIITSVNAGFGVTGMIAIFDKRAQQRTPAE
ncbi:class I SAM-dependent methyltransferase [Sphingomonas faeni]|uniref:class I SAM-dependent methyltransferase n=1 Tax=Sphingomonas faeni TaxID=185950 RepID=UPI003349C01C